MKVTDYIAELLCVNGVKTVFGYQGSSIAHLVDSIVRHSGMNFIEVRHEQGAAFAANGYALTKGELGVAIACSGPGALNLLSGVAEAYYDSIPCLFLTGQVSQKEMRDSREMRQKGFQETDIVSIVTPITKYAVTINTAEDILTELSKAIHIASQGRPGPVLLDIPHNIQCSQIEKCVLMKYGLHSENIIDVELVKQVAEKINGAKRPVILIGGGCWKLSGEEIKAIDSLNIPVVTSYRGKGIFGNELEAYCGVIGVYGERYANWAVKYSDLIICLGSRMDGRQTGGEPLQLFMNAEVVVIDIDENELLNMPQSYVKIKAEAVAFVKKLMIYISKNKAYEKWFNIVREWKKRYPIENEYTITEGVNPNLFLKELSMLTEDSTIFSIDVGQNQLWSNSSLCIRTNQTLLQSGGLGAMGFSLPAAIGGFYARAGQVICISGDGGIQMNLQELQTVKEKGIPLKVFVMNNSCLGLIRDYQSKALGERYYGAIDGFSSPNYEMLAKAFGMEYQRIFDNQFTDLLKDLLGNTAPVLVEVIVSQWSTAYPEPTYQSTMLNQSALLSEREKKMVEDEVNECM